MRIRKHGQDGWKGALGSHDGKVGGCQSSEISTDVEKYLIISSVDIASGNCKDSDTATTATNVY